MSLIPTVKFTSHGSQLACVGYKEACKSVTKGYKKALGVYFEGNLSWDTQGELALKKGKKLVSCLTYLRKYMTEQQFLKAATAHYYSTVFYA